MDAFVWSLKKKIKNIYDYGEIINSAKICENISEKLPFFIDDELSKTENIEVREHLSTCKYCNEDFSEQKEVSLLIQNYFITSTNIIESNEIQIKNAVKQAKFLYVREMVKSIAASLCYIWRFELGIYQYF